MEEIVFVEDHLLDSSLPMRSILFGEGVFETFRWNRGMPTFIDRHLSRMERGANFLDIPLPDGKRILSILKKNINYSKIKDAYVKICLLSNGSTLFYDIPHESVLLTVIKPYEFDKNPFKLSVSKFRRHSESQTNSIKSTNYLENVLAKRIAIRNGFDDTIILNEDGYLSECSSSNLFWISEGVLCTPSPVCGLLEGITRELVLEVAYDLNIETLETLSGFDILLKSESFFVTNSLIGAVSVAEVDGIKLETKSILYDRIKSELLCRLKWQPR